MLDKQHIIAETTRMFIQQGVRAIRMDDIASHMGISKRTLYELFGDKENLIGQCLAHHFESIDQLMKQRTMKARNVIEEFIYLLDDWDSIMDGNMKLMEGIKKFYPRIYEEATQDKEKGEYRLNMFKNKIRDGIREGFFLPDINVELAIMIFTDSVYGLITRPERYSQSNITPSEAFKYIVTYFFRGISTQKGIRLLDEYTLGKR